jgi:hypothetical protein
MISKETQDQVTTHPLLYRYFVNDRKMVVFQELVKSEKVDVNEHADCYPMVIKNIENQGTMEQVKKLHDLENV